MPKLFVERIAEIRIIIKAETKKRNTIIAKLHDELEKYAKAYPKGPIEINDYGRIFVKEGQKNNQHIPLLRKQQMLVTLQRMQAVLGNDVPSTYNEVKEKSIKFFELVNKAITKLNNKKTGNELIIDFLKSAANQFVYMLSLTRHPGFFSTTTQSLQDTKVSMQKTIRLLQELDRIEDRDKFEARHSC